MKKIDWKDFFENADFTQAIAEQDKADLILKVFFLSSRFNEVIIQIAKELESLDVIRDSEGYKDILFGDVSNEEFNQVFDALFCYKISGLTEQYEEPESDYSSPVFIIFSSLRFTIVYGQGRGLSVRKEAWNGRP